MASIHERVSAGERRLFVVWRGSNGRQKWTRVDARSVELQPGEASHGVKAAKRLKATIETTVSRCGTWPEPKATTRTATETINEYAPAWLERHRANLRPRAYSGYELSLRLHVLPLLGSKLLTDMGPADAKLLRDTMRAAGKSDSTIRAALIPLRSLLRDWAENERRPDPIAGVRLFKDSKKKIKPPSREQVEKAISKARPEAKEALRVAAASGLRRGELFGLRWQDLDFARNLIHVHASNYGATVTETTKTEDGERFVPLFPSIRRLLLERKARQAWSRPQDFVFGTSVGSPMDPGNFSRREWKPALVAAGLPHWRFHDLRHFAVSQLIGQRADIMLLANIAGHKDPSVTLSVYGHLMNERISEAADLYDPLQAAVH